MNQLLYWIKITLVYFVFVTTLSLFNILMSFETLRCAGCVSFRNFLFEHSSYLLINILVGLFFSILAWVLMKRYNSEDKNLKTFLIYIIIGLPFSLFYLGTLRGQVILTLITLVFISIIYGFATKSFIQRIKNSSEIN